MPKLVRFTIGNVTWKTAPGLAFRTMKGVTMPYPSKTHIQACHHDIPSWIMELGDFIWHEPTNIEGGRTTRSSKY